MNTYIEAQSLFWLVLTAIEAQDRTDKTDADFDACISAYFHNPTGLDTLRTLAEVYGVVVEQVAT